VLNRPSGGGVTIVLPSPTATRPAISNPAIQTPERQRININTASAQVLDTLPGIGDVRAKAIVAYRNEHGPFQRTDELMKVPGIGPTTYQTLRDLVSVGEPP